VPSLGLKSTDNIALEGTAGSHSLATAAHRERYAYVRGGIGFDSLGSRGRGRYHRRVDIRYYIDPETQQPHIYRHGVAAPEVEDVLRRPMEDREGARVAVGRTQAGRYLRVIYVPDPVPDSVFVITAYRLGPKALRALRRRRRRRQ
jgi:hypothetical protein